jgi:RNA polymerase sigma-70 factor (ECF subfamily)
MQERRLIAKVRTGDPKAERMLYDQHVDRVYRLAHRMTGDAALAEDLTQETFLRAFARLADFRGDAALATWIHAIAVRVVLNALRKVRRLRRYETDLADDAGDRLATEPDDPELRRRLHRAIARLSDELRLVFVMHDVEGYKHTEIAAALAVPVGTSKNRLFRARRSIRAALAGDGGAAAGRDVSQEGAS